MVFNGVYRLKIQSLILVFRPSFVNYCPSNLLFSSPPSPPPPFRRNTTYFTRLSKFQLSLVRFRVVTRRSRPSWLTNSALVYEPKCGGGGGYGVSANELSCAHGAYINFGDLTPYLTCGKIGTNLEVRRCLRHSCPSPPLLYQP
jgi:hypothetical protein